jgi:hypothetical protein
MLAHGLVRTAQWLLAGRLVSGHSHSLAAKDAHVSPNPSIERTFQRPRRVLWPAAHVER